MNTCKVDLFIHAVKYFVIRSWTREQPDDLVYDWLLDETKNTGQLWFNTSMTRRAGEPLQLSQQLSQHLLMLSTSVTHTISAPLSGPVANVA